MCGCDAAEGQEYCSDFCKNPTGDMEGGSDCGCGHSTCRTTSVWRSPSATRPHRRWLPV